MRDLPSRIPYSSGSESGHCLQGAVQAFGTLCEAITSWQHIHCQGLTNEIIHLMQMYKHTFQQVKPSNAPD